MTVGLLKKNASMLICNSSPPKANLEATVNSNAEYAIKSQRASGLYITDIYCSSTPLNCSPNVREVVLWKDAAPIPTIWVLPTPGGPPGSITTSILPEGED